MWRCWPDARARAPQCLHDDRTAVGKRWVDGALPGWCAGVGRRPAGRLRQFGWAFRCATCIRLRRRRCLSALVPRARHRHRQPPRARRRRGARGGLSVPARRPVARRRLPGESGASAAAFCRLGRAPARARRQRTRGRTGQPARTGADRVWPSPTRPPPGPPPQRCADLLWRERLPARRSAPPWRHVRRCPTTTPRGSARSACTR